MISEHTSTWTCGLSYGISANTHLLLTSAYYWPQNDPIFHILDPDIAQQVTVETSLPKYKGLGEFMAYLTGSGDIVSVNGEHWKKWRSIMVRATLL